MAISQKQLEANRKNALLGGRPKGFAAMAAERMRIFIAEELETHAAPIVQMAITQAMEGDKGARDWLSDRAHGKAVQAVELSGPNGEPLIISAKDRALADRALDDLAG